MSAEDAGETSSSRQISGATTPLPPSTVASRTRRPGTLIEELSARLTPTGLPSDVQSIVDVAVRAGMGESDPNWIWLLPVLLRQVPAAAMRIEFEALSGALTKGAPALSKASSHSDEDTMESMESMMTAMRGELQKFPRRISETLKPSVTEAVMDALESAPGRVKVELDDSKLLDAARDTFMNLYVLIAAGLGAFSTVAAFIIGSKYG